MESTRIKTDIPPCERGFGCCHADHCQTNDDKCTQYATWQNTGTANFNLPREPKKLIKQLNKLRGDAVSPAILARQAAIQKTLGPLTDDQLIKLSALTGYSVKTLKSNRFRGLSVSFIQKMESPVVKNFLAKQSEAA